MAIWAVITGGGTGIGAALARHLACVRDVKVLIVGRRLEPLINVSKAHETNITHLQGDITQDETLERISKAIPEQDEIKFLVQNAAIGEPANLEEISRQHFEYAFSVNVTAPLMLTQKLLPRLTESAGRILHIGTGVAFRSQKGTATYGITKMAFHRLYEQLRVDLDGSGVMIGSARPGVVDTEGVWDHYKLAQQLCLPHTAYFDQVKAAGEIWTPEESAAFLTFLLLETKDDEFSEKEWNMNDETHWGRWKTAK